MLTLSKDKSTVIKGIAILMMVFFHVFMGSRMNLYTGLIYIGKVPLATWLAGACWPVSFFVILSGYGLACKYQQNDIEPKRQLPRVLRLYLHYWVVLAIFITLGFFISPADYPGGLKKLVVNMLGWDVTYNPEMWFLLPYCIISVFSLYIIRLIDRLGNLVSIIITTGIFLCTSFLISRYGHFFYANRVAYQPLLCLHLLQAFTVGVALRRTSLPLNRPFPQWGIIGAIMVIVLVTCMIPNSITYLVYIPLMIILLGHINWPGWLKTVLTELGKKSMPIWMIHTWLAYYLFEPQVYSLKYAPLIFIAVLLASYLISIPVMWIAKNLYSLLTFKK